MILHSATATFGKLNHKTLTFRPGLNILEAPNEWGKSTWCAFLTAMFYGIDTRARSSASVLADKEKYAPWSGLPMEGSLELSWDGREITIQRRTRGRVPLGIFRAYETDTGLDVPELTAANCGQQLLGVERSVFLRAGFIRQSDMPVTQDEALRYRLNALVTTGDESATGVLLEQKLKELKNRCRYNQTGLLPQAQAELEQARQEYADLMALSSQAEALHTQCEILDTRIRQLTNHRAHLIYEDARKGADELAAAQESWNQAKLQADVQEYTCRDIPSREEAVKTIQTIQALQQKWMTLQTENKVPTPEKPPVPAAFADIPPDRAPAQAAEDSERYQLLQRKSGRLLLWIMAAVILGTVLGCFILWDGKQDYLWLSAAGGIAVLFCLCGCLFAHARNCRKRQLAQDMAIRYGDADEQNWIRQAQIYADRMENYEKACQEAEAARQNTEQQTGEVSRKLNALTRGQELQACIAQWQQVLSAWDAYDAARQNCLQFERQLQSLQAVVRTPEEPEMPDTLMETMAETNQLLTDLQIQQRTRRQELGQCLGKMDAIGHEDQLQERIDRLKARIERLEQMYSALELAQNALAQATNDLQRRFAPKITARAQAMLQALTGGRYEQLRFGADFSLSACAAGEDTLHSALWRSDGTADQMYFALRLAVAEILTPEAPLVLDDALVRFDDKRLSAALKILQEESREKQILLFTCQSREKRLMEAMQ